MRSGMTAFMEGQLVQQEHDVAIARVVLAGWRIEALSNATALSQGRNNAPFALLSPMGRSCGCYASRYEAARAAECAMLRGGKEPPLDCGWPPLLTEGRP